jgi:hypothetical protein
VFGAANRALDEHGRSTSALVVDTRQAPPRNDPAFEEAFRPVRVRLLRGFVRVAVLVATPMGRLQAERHAREDGLSVRAFVDEAQAKAYCAGERRSGPG